MPSYRTGGCGRSPSAVRAADIIFLYSIEPWGIALQLFEWGPPYSFQMRAATSETSIGVGRRPVSIQATMVSSIQATRALLLAGIRAFA